MDNTQYPTREEMQKLIEKAQKDLEEQLAKMTPEEREQAEKKAQKMIEEDQANIQSILDEAAKYMSGSSQKPKPKFCSNCGSPVSGGKFCTNCGSPLCTD